MTRPRLLDLFCGAGGAAMGYYRAGFDVVGVDIKPMPRYPFEFHQADALEYCAAHGAEFDAIHASPPCEHYTIMQHIRDNSEAHPDLISDVRLLLESINKPYVIENVYKAPLRASLMLCGTMFGMQIIRHRYFESNSFPPMNKRGLRKQNDDYSHDKDCWLYALNDADKKRLLSIDFRGQDAL